MGNATEGHRVLAREILLQTMEAARAGSVDELTGFDYVEGLADALARLTERKPIATAPLDGTFVMLFGGTTNEEFSSAPRPETCQSRPVTGCYVPGWIWQDSDGKSHEGCWAYAFWDDAWYSIYEHPTHWAPLEGLWTRPATEFDDEHEVQPVGISLDLSTMPAPQNIRVRRDAVIGPHDDISLSPHDAILGISPTFSQMDALTSRGLGRFIGGHVDRWEWSRIAVRSLSSGEALDLYRDLKLAEQR